MTIQSIVSFYDSYLKSNFNNNSAFSSPSFKSALTDKVNGIDVFWQSQSFIDQKQAEMLKKAGNECVKNNQYKKAIDLYKKAIEIKPDYADVYYNLAKSYRSIGEINNAIGTYNKLLELSPNDVEALVYLGKCYKDLNQYSEANKYYRKALEIDPKYDLATRSLKESENLNLAKMNPILAKTQKEQYAKENLNNSLDIVKTCAPAELYNCLSDINFVFDRTNTLSGHQNIAQYEHDKRRITIDSGYIWAAPQVIASYIIHEAVHAKDYDGYTSVKEEQDAYRESVKFWLAHNNGIKDPEMDYAASMYLINPENLDNAVEDIYTSRDASIPKVSPNHGISAYILGFNIQPDKIRELFGSFISGTSAIKTAPVFNNQGLLVNHCR